MAIEPDMVAWPEASYNMPVSIHIVDACKGLEKNPRFGSMTRCTLSTRFLSGRCPSDRARAPVRRSLHCLGSVLTACALISG